MNSMDLFEAIGEAKGTHLEEAQRMRSGERQFRHPTSRLVLIAAIVALMLFLMGCAVVLMTLQDKKIGEDSYTRNFDPFGKKIEATEVEVDVISLFGYGENPVQLATKEWYEFTETYDPDLSLMTDDNELGIPDNYYHTYGCYTWEMVDKVDEITEKYGLATLGTETLMQRWGSEAVFEALGIHNLFRASAQIETISPNGYFYPEGNFKFDFDFTMTGEDSAWEHTIWSSMYYCRKGYFDPKYTTVETDAYEQWNYTTSDGTELLLALKDAHALIFANREDAIITVSLNTNTDWVFPEDESQLPTRKVIEQAAEIFDFTILPKAVEDMDALKAELEAADAEWNAEQMSSLVEYSSYADFLKQRLWIDDSYYVLMDLYGDAEEEFLFCDEDGMITDILSVEDGVVARQMLGNPSRLCEGGILEGCHAPAYYDYFMAFYYYHFDDAGQEFIESIAYRDGAWTKCTAESSYQDISITPEEAQAIREKYTYVKLEPIPLANYPMDEGGTTLGDFLQTKEVLLTDKEKLAIYAEYAATVSSVYPREYYTFRDVNGDGEEELLMGNTQDTFNQIITIRYGSAFSLFEGNSYLCEGNVIETTNDYFWPQDGLYADVLYRKLNGHLWEDLEYLEHNTSTETWGIMKDGPDITAEEAEAIMAKYPRVELDMKPIRELLDIFYQE